MNEPHFRKVVRHRAGKRTDDVVAPVLAQLDFADADFEHAAGLCTFDRDRPGQDVRAEWIACRVRVDFQQLGRNIKAGFWNGCGRLAAYRVDRDDVAAFDSQHWCARGVEIPPMTVRYARLEMMVGHGVVIDPVEVIGANLHSVWSNSGFNSAFGITAEIMEGRMRSPIAIESL